MCTAVRVRRGISSILYERRAYIDKKVIRPIATVRYSTALGLEERRSTNRMERGRGYMGRSIGAVPRLAGVVSVSRSDGYPSENERLSTTALSAVLDELGA